jgi:hypothetical protein
MTRSGHSIHSTSGRHRARQPQTQKLTDKEIAKLKSYLPNWTSTKKSEKQGVFTAIAQAARLFALKMDLGQWKKRKQVMHPCCVENYNFNILFFYQSSDV